MKSPNKKTESLINALYESFAETINDIRSHIAKYPNQPMCFESYVVERELEQLRDSTVNDLESFDLSDLETVAETLLSEFKRIMREYRIQDALDLEDILHS